MYINKSKLSPGSPETVVMGNPTFCCAGLFITWWGYLAMNSASTLGVEGTRWGRLHRIIRLPLCHSLDKLQASIMHLTSLDLNTGLWLLWRSHVTLILASDCPREVIIWTEYWPLICQVAPVCQGDCTHHDLLIWWWLYRPPSQLHLLRWPHHPCWQNGHHSPGVTGWSSNDIF